MIGQVFHDCKIEEKIAVASTGTIYQARDQKLKVTRAIKILHPQLAVKQVAKERFSLALKSWSKLDYPNFVPLFSAIEEREYLGFIAGYVDGKTIHELLQEQGQLGISQAIDYFLQIAQAISFAHEQNILHRKLSTHNIMINKDENIRIMGLGAVRHFDHKRVTPSNLCIGKAKYMAPEQFAGTYSSQSDQYSLGIILYEILTGQMPFQADSLTSMFKCHSQKKPISPKQLNSEISPELEQLILRTLAKKAKNRFPRIKDLIDEIASITDRPDISNDSSPHSLMSHGRKALEQRKFNQAISYFHKILCIYGEDSPYFEEAQKKRLEAMEFKEEDENVLSLRADLQKSLESFDDEDMIKAQELVTKIMRTIREYPDSSRLLGVYHDLNRELSDLVENAKQDLDYRQDKVKHLVDLVKDFLEKGDYEEVRSLIQEIFELEEGNRHARKFQRIVEKRENIIAWTKFYRDGIQACQCQEFDEAIKCFKHVLELNSEHKNAKHHKEVMILERENLQARQMNIEKEYKEGVALYEKWQYSEAIEKFSDVLSMDQKHGEAHRLMQEAETRLDDNNKVEDISFFFHKGIKFYEEGLWKEAVACFNSVLKEMSDHKKALEYKAKAENEYKAK